MAAGIFTGMGLVISLWATIAGATGNMVDGFFDSRLCDGTVCKA